MVTVDRRYQEAGQAEKEFVDASITCATSGLRLSADELSSTEGSFNVIWDYIDHAIMVSPSERFVRLANEWKEQTGHYSLEWQRMMHPSFLEIIHIGQPVLPLILKDLQANGGHWSAALELLTGENPVLAEHLGFTSREREDWLAWGKEKGFLAS